MHTFTTNPTAADDGRPCLASLAVADSRLLLMLAAATAVF